MPEDRPQVAIVDYEMGNLFSVKQACERVGLSATITSEPDQVLAADGVILPGVGAFGDAMKTLEQLDLIQPLQEVAAAGKPLLGVCLGQQLLMSESAEFGRHRGLGLIEGTVDPFEAPRGPKGVLKVPQVGWNRVYRIPDGTSDSWHGTPLEDSPDGEYMYFVHSYYVKPDHPGVMVAVSRYGDVEFCSSLRVGNLFACQFHPERSGPAGLNVYRAWGQSLQRTKSGWRQ